MSDKVIETLFIRFTSIYGHAWSSLHKEGGLIDVFKKEWADALGDFDKSIIKEALLYCRTRNRLPPNLPEFIEYCRLFEKRAQLKPLTHTEQKPRNLEAGKHHLQKIKQFLNMK